MSSSALYPNYARSSVSFERGEGVWLYDQAGKAYLDFTSGIAVNALGHAHPHLVKALKEQSEKLWHVSNLFQIGQAEKLAQRLCAHSFADSVFFANSGAEAMEAAIKTARRYHYHHGRPERSTILTFEGAFHGRTLATLAAGGQEKYLEGFGPQAVGFKQLPFGDHDGLKQAVAASDIAAILVEPLQGEGGVRQVPDVCLKGLRALCDAHNVLLIFDEVQTGIGRTGRLFAHQSADIAPDIMAIAKAIGGGFPLGACLAKGDIAAVMTPGTHGTTFGGNPLACAVGNAVLDIILADGFMDHVNAMSRHLTQSLGQLLDAHGDYFTEIRGRGLLLGLKCTISNQDVMRAAFDQGLLSVCAGDNVLRLLPPLIIDAEHIRMACEKLDAACHQLKDTQNSLMGASEKR